MGLWSRLRAGFRGLNRAILRSEEHLGTVAHADQHLLAMANRLALVEHHLGYLVGLFTRREMASIMADPAFDDPLRLERSGFKVHSQYDEDGIITEIFRRIGEKSRLFVEFGCGNGRENCTGFLLMQGWRGLWIDGDEANVANIRRMWEADIAQDRLTVRCEFVTPDTIDSILASAGFSGEIDLLVVDLDGNDYHVLDRLREVQPRVICAEYNSNISPEVAWTMARDDAHVWDHVDYRVGVSLKALENLLLPRGYVLVGCAVGGVNSFFVRRDLAIGKFAEPFTAENHYHPWRSFYGGPSAPKVLWRGARS